MYAGAYLKRDVDTESDYSDYSYWYDVAYYALRQDDPDQALFGTYFYDDDGGADRHLAVHPGQGPLQR